MKKLLLAFLLLTACGDAPAPAVPDAPEVGTVDVPADAVRAPLEMVPSNVAPDRVMWSGIDPAAPRPPPPDAAMLGRRTPERPSRIGAEKPGEVLRARREPPR